jgi:transcriptional regulator with XRE-family HTH domain
MKAARKKLRLSQGEVARLAGINDRETISQYESGQIKDIDPAVIPLLAVALGLSPQQLSRGPWKAKDDAADLHVSPVAKKLAYSFDRYPLILQNEIRETIARYETLIKTHGEDAVQALLSPETASVPPVGKRRAR